MPNPRNQKLGRSNVRSANNLSPNALDTLPQNQPVDEADLVTRSAVSNGTRSAVVQDEPEEMDRNKRVPHDVLDENIQVNARQRALYPQVYSELIASGPSTIHYGNIYNNVDRSALANKWRVADTTLGFNFSLSPLSVDKQQTSATYTARRNRSKFTLKKRPALPALLDHQKAYKSYTEVTSSAVRQSLTTIARLFTDLDEFFATMFVHIITASDISSLREDLEAIRSEISLRQPTDSSSQGDVPDTIYLGDLGHHCETLLEHHEQAKLVPSGKRSPPPEFMSTHSDEQSWLDYLEDGFEIPYWKMMLDAFSTSRLNKPTLTGKVISTALISMRADILNLRHKLKETLDTTQDGGNLEGIVSVVDKRINILCSFTDRVVSDRSAGANDGLISLLLTAPNASGKPGDLDAVAVDENTSPMDQTAQPSASDPLLLVTLVLLTLIAATVPFALGFKASTEAGTISDADFWFNISSSIFTIMANFVMIIQLTQGSRFSKQYKFVWIWFSIGVLCAGVSVAIYPFLNTAWSSLLSFFATIAGFGATLSVTMTVEKPRSADSGAKKKKKKKD